MARDKSSVKILIVDDEYLVADMIRCGLEDEGYSDIDMALNLAEMPPLIEAEKAPDVILMDINMRGPTNGIKTTRLIKEQFQIPSIFITGESNDVIARALEVSRHLIRKPVDAKELAAEIEVVLEENSK